MGRSLGQQHFNLFSAGEPQRLEPGFLLGPHRQGPAGFPSEERLAPTSSSPGQTLTVSFAAVSFSLIKILITPAIQGVLKKKKGVQGGQAGEERWHWEKKPMIFQEWRSGLFSP